MPTFSDGLHIPNAPAAICALAWREGARVQAEGCVLVKFRLMVLDDLKAVKGGRGLNPSDLI